MSTAKNNPESETTLDGERRSQDREQDLDWESKVIGRLGGRLKNLPAEDSLNTDNAGWEASVLDTLRRRIERGPN